MFLFKGNASYMCGSIQGYRDIEMDEKIPCQYIKRYNRVVIIKSSKICNSIYTYPAEKNRTFYVKRVFIKTYAFFYQLLFANAIIVFWIIMPKELKQTKIKNKYYLKLVSTGGNIMPSKVLICSLLNG